MEKEIKCIMRRYDWSEERVKKAVAEANCWFECLELLGIPKRGCNYRTLKSKVVQYGINHSHFDYGYAKTHNGMHHGRRNCNRTDEEIFSYASKIKTENLKKEYIRRIQSGNAKCEECGIEDWNGKALVFHIHHIDGDHKNNAKTNLKLLCPNCHSQTENFADRKR